MIKRISVSISIRWILIVMVLLKLVLISKEEIHAYFLPHDDLWQIWAADRFCWLGHYTWDKLLHLPIYPLFIKLVNLTGLPLRIGSELIYCAAACCLCLSLRRLGFGFLLTTLAAAAIIFQPASFQIPNRAGAEILLAPLLMFALAGSLSWWSTRHSPFAWNQTLWTGICWALAWNVRKESILLLGLLGIIALCLVIADHKTGIREIGRRLATGVLFPLFMSLALSAGISTLNYAKWGLYTTSILTSTGFKAAYSALQSIPPSCPRQFIGVPVESREKAYGVSAQFAKLRPHLEGRIGANWAYISKTTFTDPIGMTGLNAREIASGWFYWALHDAVVASGNGKTPAEENLFLQSVADEIQKAQKKGLLERRWVPVAMIEPNWRLWLPSLPSSLLSVSSLFMKSYVTPVFVYDDGSASDVSWMFDETANRRTTLTRPRDGIISGWMLAEHGKIRSLSLRSPEGTVAETGPSVMRPDITLLEKTGFSLKFPANLQGLKANGLLRVDLEDKTGVDIPISEISTRHILTRNTGSSVVNIGFDSMDLPAPANAWTKHLQSLWESIYLEVSFWAVWLLVLSVPALLWIYVRERTLPAFAVAFVLFGSIVAVRIVFFALLDATSWPAANQPRYVYPVMPLFAALLVTSLAIVLYAAKDIFHMISIFNTKRCQVS